MDIPAPISGHTPAIDQRMGLVVQHPFDRYLSGERLEQDVEEQGFLREFGMGSWLTSQPVRFGTTRVEFIR